MATTATKANFAAVGSGAALAVAWYMQWLIPWWDQMPMDVQAVHVTAVVLGIPWLATYYSPPNRPIAQFGTLERPAERPISVTQP